jgi:signal transduction histidine kinase
MTDPPRPPRRGSAGPLGETDERRPRVHESVFAKLIAIMLAMASSLLLVVAIFFWFIVGPNVNTSIHHILDDYTAAVAASSPDLQKARQLGARIDMQMRYEGPDGSWSTADDLPTIDDVRNQGAAAWRQHGAQRDFSIVPAANGGTYLFVWNFSERMQQVHSALVVLLLLIMTAVVLTAYAVLTHLLRPLRSLRDGVARLSEGQLDVVLPDSTRDEFGTLTDAFNRMVSRVRAMIGARDQLLLDVSHELRSPVTRLKVALELLPESDQRRRMAADVTEMELMIGELLELERLRAGRGITTERQDLVPILRGVAEGFQHRTPGVHLVSNPLEILVDVDAERIRTALRNLLENAAKYSLPHSRPVEISTGLSGDTVVIRVTDDGPGIPESDVERVFEPFFRVDPSRSKTTGGYGLGLSICKRVMEAHGGTIALEPRSGRGASFVLTLPRSA